MTDFYPTGTCFDDIAEVMLYLKINKSNFDPKKFRLVHAIVLNDQLGEYAHAWVIYDDLRYEMKFFMGDKVIASGRPDSPEWKQIIVKQYSYSMMDVIEKVKKHGDTTGPWEPDILKQCNDPRKPSLQE